MLKRNSRMTALFFALALALACAPMTTAAPPPAASPVFDPASLNVIIAQTAGAAATQTFAAMPTSTVTATSTKTPTETPTETPTFFFSLATPTVPTLTPTLEISSNPYACRLTAQEPPDNSVYSKKVDFAVIWRVMNVGANSWDANNVDYYYFRGDKMHKAPAYDLPKSVSTGGQVDLIVNMRTPEVEGTYNTIWLLRAGKDDFCKLHLTIQVR